MFLRGKLRLRITRTLFGMETVYIGEFPSNLNDLSYKQKKQYIIKKTKYLWKPGRERDEQAQNFV